MFDVGFFEIILISVISLIVLGPERLPKAARTVGRWVGKARATVSAFKTDIDRELQLEEMRAKLEEHTKFLQDAKSAIAKESHALSESANSIHQDMRQLVDSEEGDGAKANYKPYPEDGSDDALPLNKQSLTASSQSEEEDDDSYYDVPAHEQEYDEEDVVVNHYELAQQAKQKADSDQDNVEHQAEPQQDSTPSTKPNEPKQH